MNTMNIIVKDKNFINIKMYKLKRKKKDYFYSITLHYFYVI